MRLTLLSMALGALLAGGQRDVGLALKGWHYEKVDPHTHKQRLSIEAKSFGTTHEPAVFVLHNMTARIYAENGVTYTEVTSERALMNEKLGTLTYGPDLSTVIKLK